LARLEREASGPEAEARWRAGVKEGLSALREALGGAAAAPFDAGSESLDDLRDQAPRLIHALRRLNADRDRLTDRLDALIARSADASAAALGRGVRQVITDVRAYRRRISDLIHEAYIVDIGGEM
ncbi:MAG TPA: hypothetical protein VE172_18315, partial [Stackebrandtia sp.]|uniref:hypothetical protein n=1 Tax=Stackebrandtia sp. TaxID=2023065 RepID=UPI002D47378C